MILCCHLNVICVVSTTGHRVILANCSSYHGREQNTGNLSQLSGNIRKHLPGSMGSIEICSTPDIFSCDIFTTKSHYIHLLHAHSGIYLKLNALVPVCSAYEKPIICCDDQPISAVPSKRIIDFNIRLSTPKLSLGSWFCILLLIYIDAIIVI